LAVLRYEKGAFEKVKCDAFGKSGGRRIVPGQYTAADPLGRAIMICAVEKQKFVFVATRDSNNNFLLESPLEAHRQNAIVFDCKALDVGSENPQFGCLEVDYNTTEKKLVLYELDMGLNHVERKKEITVDDSASMLIAVPGVENGGPGGLIVCSENQIEYIAPEETIRHSIKIPKRAHVPETRSTIVVSYATNLAKLQDKTVLFFVVQTEYGDLFKVELDGDAIVTVSGIRCEYLDSVPVANSLCLSKRGHLFVASEMGDHYLYKFTQADLVLKDTLPSLHPVTQLQVTDLCKEDRRQMYTTCGTGKRSSLRILRHGLEVTEMAVTPLPGVPGAVGTLKKDGKDKYIVVSFKDATLVLQVGEQTVQQANDSGIRTDVTTLAVGSLEDGTVVQVHPKGIVLIRDGQQVETWDSSMGKRVDCASINTRQIVVLLEGGSVVYFEKNNDSQKMLANPTATLQLGEDAKCVDMDQVPQGRQRAAFLAIGTFKRNQVSQVLLLSLDPATPLKLVSSQVVPDQADTVCFHHDYLYAGLCNGVVVKAKLDSSNGSVLDSQTQFLGAASVRCMRVPLSEKETGVMMLSSRPWLAFKDKSVPLSYNALSWACGLVTDDVGEAIVAVATSQVNGERVNTLRVIGLEDLDQTFNSQVVPLEYTPRHLLIHANHAIVIEGDYNVEPSQDEKLIMHPKAGVPGKWYGNIRLIRDANCVDVVALAKDEFVTCAAFMPLVVNASKGQLLDTEAKLAAAEKFLVVGIAVGMKLHDPSYSPAGFIKVFRFISNPPSLTLMSATKVESPPRSVCGLHGLCLSGVGQMLRVYELGNANLLCKSELKCMPTIAMKLQVLGNRIYAFDSHESAIFLTFSPNDTSLHLLADDAIPRICTTGHVLDFDTVAGADKFGNVFVLRLPSEVSDVSIASHAKSTVWDQATISSAPNKLELLAMYHTGEIVTAMHKTCIVPGRVETLMFSTVNGSIMAMIPLPSKKDIDFFSLLEMHMRSEQAIMLVGRDHLSWRSAFSPVRNVVDGQLCEAFSKLSSSRQQAIASELNRSPSEVLKKIQDLRNCLL